MKGARASIATVVFSFAALATLGCGSATSGVYHPPEPEPGALPPAPWNGAPLIDVPAVYRDQWQKADNRATCAIVAPASLGEGKNATPRAATFSGGWGVAYDLPGLRSAFGVAGTSSTFDSQTYDNWPHKIAWADGSSVGYGPEGGGAGPNQLAYLRIAGQTCLYNVWSRLGISHLEHLIEALRMR